MSILKFSVTIEKFKTKGEKTGWTYMSIPADLAQQIKPNNKKTFRVKGKLDNYAFSGLALLPMGEGDFILALNQSIRKGIGKRAGAVLNVQMEEDKTTYQLNAELMECLNDEPEALQFFNTMPSSHQRYFSKWIEAAKTEPTKAKRIAQSITGFLRKQNFSEMMGSNMLNRTAS